MKRRANDKGFSMVELIIVIAIMAILAGVLTPVLLRYVEEARIRSDEEKISSLEKTVALAVGEVEIQEELLSLPSPAELRFYPGIGFEDSEGKISALKKYVEESLPADKMHLKSRQYKSDTSYYKVMLGSSGVEVTIEKQ